ncbi:MAG TPA: polysaccharide biosynthesis protein [Patescibacteria group bacterium]|nr:polysaccharide biosynthesis protein [Patescibacteria group bacterium]
MSNEEIMKNILIIGAGRAGKLLKKDIDSHHPRCQVVGFVDDNKDLKNSLLLGNISDMARLTRAYEIDEIVIAIPSTDGKLIRRILLENIKNRIPIKIVPRNQKIISSSKVHYAATKDLEGGDFLGRPFVRQSVERVKKFYRGKVVFVTGGAGSIGSDIVKQLIDLDVKKVVVYDNSEYLIFLLEQQLKESGLRDRSELIVGSILHYNKLNMLMKRIRPDIVFHAAAYKHVHLMQDNIDEAIYNNVIGTKRVIDAALANGVKLFTFISTDKVVNPTSIMGATKKLCEYYIQSLKPEKMKFNIVRFGNVINSNGSALPLFERQIVLHKYVTVTHKKMERFFMSIREAAQLVIESTANGKTDVIHILNMGELINIYEIALCLIRSKNLVPGKDVEVSITGLRKGEKMVEELYTETEEGNMIKTESGRIFSLKNYDRCPVDIEKTLDELEAMVKNGVKQSELSQRLKKIFPSLKNC